MPALIGPVIGPPIGGFITTYFHWRWIFLINIPICLLGIWLALRFIPNFRERDVPRFDLVGFMLSGVGLSAAMLGLATLWEHMLSPRALAVCVAVGMVTLTAYVWHAHRTEHPLLDLRLFRLSTFRAGVIGGALFRSGQGAVPFLLPMMLQIAFGLNPLPSGLLTFAAAVGALFMKTLTTTILGRWGFRTVLSANAIAASVVLAACGLFSITTPHAVILTVLLIGGCLRSLQFTSLNAISFAEVSPREMSQATSLMSVGQQLSMSLGVMIWAYALQGAAWIRGGVGLLVQDFQIAFFVVKPQTRRTLECVLTADDSEFTRELLKDLLVKRQLAKTVVAVENGQTCVAEYTKQVTEGQAPDLIVLDLEMPVMDGVSAARILRSVEAKFEKGKALILFFSARKCDEDLKRQLELLAPASYVNKGSDGDPEQLIERIEQLINRLHPSR